MTDIWKGIKAVDIKLPIDILTDFTDSFNEKFVGRCEMKLFQRNKSIIETFSDSTYLENPIGIQTEIYLKLEAKLLDNYQLTVFSVVYDLATVYPCVLNDKLNQKVHRCESSADLTKAIMEVFRSEKFLTSASMILTQVNRAEEVQMA